MSFNTIVIHSPWFLILLPILFLIFFFANKLRASREPRIKFSQVPLLQKIGKQNIQRATFLQKIPTVLRVLAMILIILALARIQERSATMQMPETTSGTDIMICLDTSPSMSAIDGEINYRDADLRDRLSVAKEVITNFIHGRYSDRIGLVIFSGGALTVCPLTTDYNALLSLIPNITVKSTHTSGTAIGDAIATSINRLKDSDAKSKILILVTDGKNNAGQIEPVSASELAAKLGIKIYTIGVAKKGQAYMPIEDPITGRTLYGRINEEIDEESLEKIAENTGGTYSRASHPEDLGTIFKRIDQMEKTKLKAKPSYSYTELYNLFLIPAIMLLLLERVIAYTISRKLP